MPPKKSKTTARNDSSANVGYEAQLWAMADALRGSMDAADYKHVVLGLLFLKYISDAFEEQHASLVADKASGADAEDPNEYRAQSIFWVPPEARWPHLKVQARQPTFGRLVEMLEPYRGRVYDPCCGSSGMFVQSVEFIRAHATGNGNGKSGNGGKVKGSAKPDISIYGQESNYTTWRLAKMNLAIRSIDGQIGHGDTFHNDRHPDLKADFVLANPPFNISDWGGERLRDDKRWQYRAPAEGDASVGVLR